MTDEKVGVLGSGDVGRRLASAFVSEGHEVMLGSRTPDKPEVVEWREANGPKAHAGPFAKAAGFGQWVVLAVAGMAAVSVVESVAESLKDKLVIDATNPLEFREEGPPGLFVGGWDSLGERVQRAAPEARVVKAFNIIGNPLMYKPDLPGGPPTMFFCGEDAEAKRTMETVLQRFGHEPVDVGGIEAARYLEAMVPVWVAYGMRSGAWSHAFKMLSG